MSVINVANVLKAHNQQSLKTFLWLTSKINYGKLYSRIARSCLYPNEEVKCVLLEYVYTSRTYEAQGNPNLIEYLPESTILVHHAINSPDFIRLLDNYFGVEDDKVSIYVRQKIKSDGTPDFHKKQLVIKFEPWAFTPRPVS